MVVAYGSTEILDVGSPTSCRLLSPARARASRLQPSPSSPSLFFLIWLASFAPGPSSWRASVAPGDRIWPTSRLSCSARLGHLLTFLTSLGRRASSRPSRRPWARAARTACPRPACVTSLASETMSSPPHTTAGEPSTPSNAGASDRALGRPAGQAVLHHQQVDVLLRGAVLRSSTVLSDVQAHRRRRRSRSLTPSSRFFRSSVIRFFDVFAHGTKLQLSA